MKADIKEKIKDAQEFLLNAVLEFLKNHPNTFFGAKKISDRLGLIEGHNFWFAHGLLTELKNRGKVEQRYRRGFKYKKKEDS